MGINDSDCWTGQTFTRLALAGTSLEDSEFTNCRFEACDFSGAVLRSASFDECAFLACNLVLPDLTGARLVNAAFTDCKLVGIEFWKLGQKALDFSFSRCMLRSCNFSGLTMKRNAFLDCELEGCSFQDAFLQECRFDRSLFRETLFHKTNLQKASFRGALGYAIDTGVNDVRKAEFSLPEALSLLAGFGIVLRDGEDGRG